MELQRNVCKMRCENCGDEQHGLDWVEKGHSAFQIIHDLTCTECSDVLCETFQSTPRTLVDEVI